MSSTAPATRLSSIGKVTVNVVGTPFVTTIERLTPLLTGCKRALEDAEVQQAAHEESEAAYLREQYQQPPPPGTYDAYGGQNYYALQQQQRQYSVTFRGAIVGDHFV